jgi:hypothetical protein
MSDINPWVGAKAKAKFGLDQLYASDGGWWHGRMFRPYIQNIQTGSIRHRGRKGFILPNNMLILTTQ